MVTGVRFVSIPAAHEQLDYDPEYGYPYRGYVVTLGGVTIYHAGDCVPYDGLVERLVALDVDIALLPINGRDYFRLSRGSTGNFNYPGEAAELAAAAGIRLLIPMHFGMHLANTERPGYLVAIWQSTFPTRNSMSWCRESGASTLGRLQACSLSRLDGSRSLGMEDMKCNLARLT